VYVQQHDRTGQLQLRQGSQPMLDTALGGVLPESRSQIVGAKTDLQFPHGDFHIALPPTTIAIGSLSFCQEDGEACVIAVILSSFVIDHCLSSWPTTG
jgi:hypothetical protein